MKYFFLILLFTMSLKVEASNWGELEQNYTYRLDQDVILSQLTIPKSSSLYLQDIIGLDMIKVVIFEFKWQECHDDLVFNELEIYPSEMADIGFEIEKCLIKVYLETKDLRFKSLFKEKK